MEIDESARERILRYLDAVLEKHLLVDAVSADKRSVE